MEKVNSSMTNKILAVKKAINCLMTRLRLQGTSTIKSYFRTMRIAVNNLDSKTKLTIKTI